MKRRLSMLLAVAMLATSLAACSSGGGSTSQSSEQPAGETPATSTETPSSEAPSSEAEPASGEQVELKLWHYYSGDSAQDIVDLCNRYTSEVNPNVKVAVTMLPFGDFKKQLSVSSAASSLPDMVFIDNCDAVAYAAMGMFADLTEAMKDNAEIAKYYEGIMKTGYYDGKLYSVPSVSNNQGIYYNKDMFEAAGIQKVPETWDEIRETAKALTKDGVYGFGMSAVSNEEGTSQFLPFKIAAGDEDMYSLDSEGGLRALSFLTDLVKDGSMPKDVISWSQSDVGTQFKTGKIAMMMMGCWYINEYEEQNPELNWDVFPIKDKTFGTIYGGENLAVINGPNKDAAIEWVKWFMSYDINKEWNFKMAHFPAREESLTDPEYTANPHWKTFLELIPYTKPRPADPKWPEISLGYQLALQEALTLQKTPEEAVKDGQAMIDAARG